MKIGAANGESNIGRTGEGRKPGDAQRSQANESALRRDAGGKRRKQRRRREASGTRKAKNGGSQRYGMQRSAGRRRSQGRSVQKMWRRLHAGWMPELPDIAAYISALEPRIVGHPLVRVRLGNAFLLRTVEPGIGEVEGRVVRGMRRVGKRIAIGVDGDLWLVLHLMIAGRLHWRAAGARLAGRQSLAAFDFAGGSLVLTEAGTKRRASLHVVSGRGRIARD